MKIKNINTPQPLTIAESDRQTTAHFVSSDHRLSATIFVNIVPRPDYDYTTNRVPLYIDAIPQYTVYLSRDYERISEIKTPDLSYAIANAMMHVTTK